MAKKILQRLLPNLPALKQRHPWLGRCLGALMEREDLWHINRRSISLGLAVGLFCAFLPIPIQMFFAAAVAIVVRANFVLAVSSVWITNPFTITPIYYFCYRVGRFLLGWPPPENFDFEWTFAWFTSGLLEIWQPFLFGCFFVGTVAAFLGYFSMRIFWRYSVILQHRERRKRKSR